MLPAYSKRENDIRLVEGYAYQPYGTPTILVPASGATNVNWDWAREDVRQTYADFQARTDVPAALRIGAEILGPPQTKTEAVLALGFAVIPGGNAAKGLKAANKLDDPAEFLLDWGRKAADDADAFRDATKWGREVPGGGVGAAHRRTGQTVLGHSPKYVEKGEELGARYFRIPEEHYAKLAAKGEAWPANVRFLERTIARGDEVLLSNLPSKARESTLQREISYLGEHGYKFIEQLRMVRSR